MLVVIDEQALREMGWTVTNGEWRHPVTSGVFTLETAIEVMRRAAIGYRANKDLDWAAAPDDIEWQETLVATFTEGATWRTSEGEFKCYPEKKIAVLMKGDPKTTAIGRIITVFDHMGWKTIVMLGGAKLILLLHNPGDKEADPVGVPTSCVLCDCALICPKKNMNILPDMNPICFACATKGPDYVIEQLKAKEAASG